MQVNVLKIDKNNIRPIWRSYYSSLFLCIKDYIKMRFLLPFVQKGLIEPIIARPIYFLLGKKVP